MKANDSKRIAVCLVVDEEGCILMGKRKDNGLWTTPAGHIENNEDPFHGACRELYEETGLDAKHIDLKRVEYNSKKNIMLYLFLVQCEDCDKITNEHDPDEEFEQIAFFADPSELIEELHVPLEDNIALKWWSLN